MDHGLIQSSAFAVSGGTIGHAAPYSAKSCIPAWPSVRMPARSYVRTSVHPCTHSLLGTHVSIRPYARTTVAQAYRRMYP